MNDADEYYEAARLMLDAARLLMKQGDGAGTGLWPRATAFVTRHAVETTLRGYWVERGFDVADASAHAQLLCLHHYADETAADDLAYAWSALSSACHFHPYELPPTAIELEQLIHIVEEGLTSIQLETATTRRD